MVVFASLIPDLVDKPLAWEIGIFASGYALGHSIFVATSASLVVGRITSSRGKPRIGWAFAIGYLLHPPADVVSKYVLDGERRLNRILWPVRRNGGGYDSGFRHEFTENTVEYGLWVSEQVTSGEPVPYLLVTLGLAGFGALLWVYDGMPVGREVYYTLRRTGRAVVRRLGHK